MPHLVPRLELVPVSYSDAFMVDVPSSFAGKYFPAYLPITVLIFVAYPHQCSIFFFYREMVMKYRRFLV